MGYILTRPEPTTLPPDSWGRIQTTNCCSHCGSGIDAENKCCERCGAPNENYKQEKVISKTEKTQGEKIENEICAMQNVLILKLKCGLDTSETSKILTMLNKALDQELISNMTVVW
jgi:predicted amidophosphoribosyltransferase